MSKKKKVETRKCVVCSKAFTPKVANQVTCCDACRKTHKVSMNKARKSKSKADANTVKKPVAKTIKGKATEKIVLCKKKSKAAVAKKTVAKKEAKKDIDTIITVKNGNPFKVFVLASIIRDRAMMEIIDSKSLFAS